MCLGFLLGMLNAFPRTLTVGGCSCRRGRRQPVSCLNAGGVGGRSATSIQALVGGGQLSQCGRWGVSYLNAGGGGGSSVSMQAGVEGENSQLSQCKPPWQPGSQTHLQGLTVELFGMLKCVCERISMCSNVWVSMCECVWLLTCTCMCGAQKSTSVLSFRS